MTTVTIGITDLDADSVVESDGRIVNTYTVGYLYQTDSATRPTAADITADLGISPGSPFGDDANATAKSVKIKALKARPPHCKYTAVVTWATNAAVPATVSTDPTTRRVLWSIKPTIQQTYIFEDKNDELIVNTAGQPFDGGVPVDIRRGTVVARRTIDATGYNKSTVLANSGKVNSVTYLGGAPGTVQVDIEAEEKWEGAYHTWEETYTFVYNPRGHQPLIANAGFFQRTGVGSNDLLRLTERDLDGTSPTDNPLQEPEPLDDDGIMVPVSARPASCTFVTVDFFDAMDFATFGL